MIEKARLKVIRPKIYNVESEGRVSEFRNPGSKSFHLDHIYLIESKAQ